MRPSTRFTAPVVTAVVLSVLLAACGQVNANPDPSETPKPTPVATPSTDPTPKPTVKPVATPAPAPEKPVATPMPTPVATPTPIKLVEHRVPMIARSTADRVNVRERPDLDAAIYRWDTGDKVYEVRLAAGQVVEVITGPFYADGESWYQIQAADDRYPGFGKAWVAGRFLEKIDDHVYAGLVASFTGLGTNGSAAAGVPAWSPLTVEFAAAPMPGDASCTIELELTDTKGRIVGLGSFSAEGTIVGTIGSADVAELYQETSGGVAVQVTTDCSSHVVLMNYPF